MAEAALWSNWPGQSGGEAEQVIDIEQAERTKLQLQVFVEFLPQALCFNLELRFFLNEYSEIAHLGR